MEERPYHWSFTKVGEPEIGGSMRALHTASRPLESSCEVTLGTSTSESGWLDW